MEIKSFLDECLGVRVREKTYYLAVSGGVDSIVLLHLFHLQKLKIVVLHVNYQLRGDASDQDQQLIESWCIELNTPFKIKIVAYNALKDRKSGNLQAMARDIRYQFFEEQMNNDENAILVTGQHKNDQAETLLMQLDRKPGVMALAGMLAFDGKKMRPLLRYKKQEIYDFAQDQKLTWREDVSNSKNDYYRNFIRNVIVPEWETQKTDIVEKLAETALFYQKIQAEIELRILEILGTEKSISSVTFHRMLSIEKAEVLRQWNFPIQYLNEIDQLAFSKVGKFVQHGNLKIYKERLQYSLVEDQTVVIPELQIESVTSFEKGNRDIAFLDESKIQGELKLRIWKKGDKMQVLGMQQTKLISDILANEKVQSHSKAQHLVLEDDVCIHWLVGIRVSEISKVRPETQNILKISFVK